MDNAALLRAMDSEATSSAAQYISGLAVLVVHAIKLEVIACFLYDFLQPLQDPYKLADNPMSRNRRSSVLRGVRPHIIYVGKV